MLFLTCIMGKADARRKRNRETGFIVLKKLTMFKKCQQGKMAQQPATGRLASQVEEEDAFVKSGMAAIAAEHAKYLTTDTDGKGCIAVPTDTYETLLRATFCYEGSQLSLAGKDGSLKSAIPLRFDPTKKVLFASDPHDGRMLVPLNLVCRHLDQQKQQGMPFGAVSSLGTEFFRQVEAAGRANHPAQEPEVFQYDEHGKYIGARINGHFVPANELTQAGLCLVCRSTAMKRCLGCKQAHYCSVECQKLDWTHHKTICGRLQPDKDMGDFVVASRSDANIAEIQTLTSKPRAVQQHLMDQAQLN
jgi:hypothetical protein